MKHLLILLALAATMIASGQESKPYDAYGNKIMNPVLIIKTPITKKAAKAFWDSAGKATSIVGQAEIDPRFFNKPLYVLTDGIQHRISSYTLDTAKPEVFTMGDGFSWKRDANAQFHIGEVLDSYYGIQYGDTLEIPSSVKVLIIDGKPFDIIRTVEVKPPHAFGEWEPAHQIWTWPYTPAVMDSTSIRIMRHGIDVGPTKHNKP